MRFSVKVNVEIVVICQLSAMRHDPGMICCRQANMAARRESSSSSYSACHTFCSTLAFYQHRSSFWLLLQSAHNMESQQPNPTDATQSSMDKDLERGSLDDTPTGTSKNLYRGYLPPVIAKATSQATSKATNEGFARTHWQQFIHGVTAYLDEHVHASDNPSRPGNRRRVPPNHINDDSGPKAQYEHGGESQDDELDFDESSGLDKSDGWLNVFNRYKKLDEDWSERMNKYIDSLLIFAGLFSTVLTAFLVEIYDKLQPDNSQYTVPILLEISKQLNALSSGQPASAISISLEPEKPSPIRMATTVLWFISLVLSLCAALYGLLVKQWIREYMRWTSIFPVQHAVHVRYHRKKNLGAWYIEWIVMVLSSSLTIGLVFFLAGIAVLLFDVNFIIAVFIAIVVGFALLEAFCVAMLPIFVPNCPYRSSLTSLLLITQLSALKVLDLLRAWIPWIPRLTTTASALLKNPRGAFGFHKEDLWAKQDIIRNLPSDPDQRLQQKWKVLYELVTQQQVPDEIIAQCFSNLPGPPPPHLPSENEDSQESHESTIWTPQTKSKVDSLEWQLYYQCQILLGVFKKHPHLNLPPSNVSNLRKYLSDSLWSVSGHPDESPSFNINKDLTLSFLIETRRLHPSAKNAILRCVSSLTSSALNQHLFFPNINMGFNLFANLLGLHFILVNSIDPDQSGGKGNLFNSYYHTLIGIISTGLSSMSATDLTSGTVRRVRPAQVPPMPHSKIGDYKARIEFAGALLSLSSLTPSPADPDMTKFLSPPMTVTWKFDANMVNSFMSAAINFAKCQRSIRDSAPHTSIAVPSVSLSQADGYIAGEQADFSLSTDTFWAMAAIVFNARIKEGSPRHDKGHKQPEVRKFFNAIQWALDTEIKRLELRTDNEDDLKSVRSRKRWEMLGYIFVYRENLSPEFITTLEDAHSKRVVDIDEMIKSSEGHLALPNLKGPDFVNLLRGGMSTDRS